MKPFVILLDITKSGWPGWNVRRVIRSRNVVPILDWNRGLESSFLFWLHQYKAVIESK